MAFPFSRGHSASKSMDKQTRIAARRRCVVETLERRELLAADITVFADSFEVGANSNDWSGDWAEDAQNDWFRSSQRATDGSVSAEVDGRATNATLSLATPIDLSSYATAELTFDWLIEKGFDSGEYLSLDLSSDGGATWQTDVRRLSGNVDPENTWHSESIDLAPYLTSEFVLRFRSLVSGSREDANVDNVKITATTPAGPPQISIGDAEVVEGDQELRFLDNLVPPNIDPEYIAFGPDGNLYVASILGDSVLRYDPTTGQFLGTFVEPASGGLDRPFGIAFGPDGKLYVSSRAEAATGRSGEILRYNGQTGDFIDAFVPEGRGGLVKPNGLVFGPDGDLYVTSRETDEILRYDGDTGAFLGAFVTTGSGGLNSPIALTFGEHDGNLYVTDTSGGSTGQVLRFDGETGAFIDEFVSTDENGGLARPLFLDFGPDGHLYVTSSLTNAILRYDGTTGAFIDKYLAAPTGDLANPSSFLFDEDGVVYVSSRETINSSEVLGSVKRFGPSSLAAFTVSLSHTSDEPVTVDFTTSGGSALVGDDYEAASGTLVFEPGVTTRTILVPTVDDLEAEPTETFAVNLSNATGATIFDGVAIGTILDSDPASQPPTAEDDYYSVAEDGVLYVAAPGVLNGDSDPEHDPLTARLVDGPSNGALSFAADGSFDYTPDANYNGPDSFTYVASDGESDSNLATVSITVTPVNDAPVAFADSYSATQDQTLAISAAGLLKNDVDPDGDAVSVVPWSGATAQGGQVVLGADGSFVYTPAMGFVGADNFAYSVTDGSLTSAPALVSIDVSAASVNALYVYDIRFESFWGGRYRRAVFEIRSDSDADGVGTSADDGAASVAIEVEFAGRTYSGTTNGSGLFATSWLRGTNSDTVAEVVDLALADFTWDPLALDLEGDSDGDSLPDATVG